MPKLVDKALRPLTVEKLKPKTKRYDVFDAAVRGLGVRIATSGIKTWFVMRRVNGRMVRHTLGRYPEMGLSDARQGAAPLLEDMARGQLPSRGGDGELFDAVFEEWLIRDQGQHRSRKTVEGALRLHVLPYLRGQPIETIRKKDILRVLDAVKNAGAQVQANRVFSLLRRMFNWCLERDILAIHPMAGMKAPTKEISRDRVLSHDELHAIWEAADEDGYPWGPMTRLLILTGQRLDEVSGARWSEFDLGAETWNLPADRTKNGRPHIVHLSMVAVEILRGLPRINNSDWVFTTTGLGPIKGFSKAKKRLDKQSKVSGWVYHDLRRSFATHITQALGVSPVVTDRILNHASGAVRGIAAVYQRGEYLEQRQQAMEAWGTLIEHGLKSSDAVIPFKRADR